MTSEINGEKRRPLVGIYTPMLEGFYYGEIVGQILTLCHIKHYRVVIIKTGDYGNFNSHINVDDMDMVIVIRNAIHTEMAKALLEAGKRVVSISYDYFPLKIPLVTSDHAAGIELIINHLKGAGHNKFVFIGNLTNFDIRKRYEEFSEQIEKAGLETAECEVIQVADDLVSGGYEGADKYVEQTCTATAVICGTSMNGIGFTERLEKHSVDLKGLVAVAGFDAISFIPVLEPGIATVDQNLNLIAHKALSLVENSLQENEKQHCHLVAPKLICEESGFAKSEEAYLATSFELAELYNANYMKSVLCNVSEWVRSIASRKLDNIMMLRPLFQRMLSAASISRSVRGKSGNQYLVYTKIIGLKSVQRVDVKDPASVSPEAKFPCAFSELKPQEYDVVMHLPRLVNNRLWGFISTYGKAENSKLPCSYTGFTTYLNQIVDLMGQQAHLEPKGSEENTAVELARKKVEGEILWNINTNEVVWGDKALEILGFTKELEQKIYKHMDMYDRVYDEDVGLLRDYLLGDKNRDVPVQVRYKQKSRELVDCELHALGEDENQFTRIKISVSIAGE